LHAHAKARLARDMRLRNMIFGDLAKATNGKTRKNELRDLVRQAG